MPTTLLWIWIYGPAIFMLIVAISIFVLVLTFRIENGIIAQSAAATALYAIIMYVSLIAISFIAREIFFNFNSEGAGFASLGTMFVYACSFVVLIPAYLIAYTTCRNKSKSDPVKYSVQHIFFGKTIALFWSGFLFLVAMFVLYPFIWAIGLDQAQLSKTDYWLVSHSFAGDHIYFCHDKCDFWRYGARPLSADAETFHILNDIYAADEIRVFFNGKPIPGADPYTFTVVDKVYAYDSRASYLNGQILRSSATTTLKRIPISGSLKQSGWYTNGTDLICDESVLPKKNYVVRNATTSPEVFITNQYPDISTFRLVASKERAIPRGWDKVSNAGGVYEWRSKGFDLVPAENHRDPDQWTYAVDAGGVYIWRTTTTDQGWCELFRIEGISPRDEIDPITMYQIRRNTDPLKTFEFHRSLIFPTYESATY